MRMVFIMHAAASASATASMQQIYQNDLQHDNIQRTLFISWDRLSSIRTDRPEGMCRTRTADSVLLTC
jgi:hypothetical protein